MIWAEYMQILMKPERKRNCHSWLYDNLSYNDVHLIILV